MLAEIDSIVLFRCRDRSWANTMLRAKNTLTAEDARMVEAALRQSVTTWQTIPAPSKRSPAFEPIDTHGTRIDEATAEPLRPQEHAQRRSPPITKTVRHRNKEHLAVRPHAAMPDLRQTAL